MKHMKLLALVVSALIMQPMYADSKVDTEETAAKKTAKVVWYTAKTAAGGSRCMVDVFQEGRMATRLAWSMGCSS